MEEFKEIENEERRLKEMSDALKKICKTKIEKLVEERFKNFNNED